MVKCGKHWKYRAWRGKEKTQTLEAGRQTIQVKDAENDEFAVDMRKTNSHVYNHSDDI